MVNNPEFEKKINRSLDGKFASKPGADTQPMEAELECDDPYERYQNLDSDHYIRPLDFRDQLRVAIGGEPDPTLMHSCLAQAHEQHRREAQHLWDEVNAEATESFNEGIPPESGEWVESLREESPYLPGEATAEHWDKAIFNHAKDYDHLRRAVYDTGIGLYHERASKEGATR